MKYVFTAGVVIFLVALGVRFLTWQDNRHQIGRVQTSVTQGYKDSARQLLAGDFRTFVNDINHMGHPPGYSILLAGIFKVAGESNNAIHVVQIVGDALAVIVLFLIALKLVTPPVAIIAALLAALSPQFAYFSVLLLPDSLSVLPILLAVYFLVRAREDKKLVNFAIAGALIGVSCWLRANALLLAPFLAAGTFLFVDRGRRLRAAAAVLAGAIVVIAPITIKNAIVFHRFIPLSLGAGQTLLEGIADYDEERSFNIPQTDLGIMRQEAAWYGKPEYAQLLFGADGVERERQRVRRGLGVIASHPLWFASVVARRGIDSTRLEPVPVVARESPVSRDVPRVESTNAKLTRIQGDDPSYATLYTSEAMDVRTNTDYVLNLSLRLEQGRVVVKITDVIQESVLASMGVDLIEGLQEQPFHDLAIPFVSAEHSQVRLTISNNALPNSVVDIGPAKLVELGSSSHQWLRHLRIPLRGVQRVFKTVWILPLVVLGLVFMIRERKWTTLGIVLMVPAYYLLVQSVLHTERRYVFIVHFFFLILVAHAIASIILLLARRKDRKPQTAD